jgi:hypothetical protein
MSCSTTPGGTPSFNQLDRRQHVRCRSPYRRPRLGEFIEPPEVVGQLVEQSLLFDDAAVGLRQIEPAIALVIQQPLQPLLSLLYARCAQLVTFLELGNKLIRVVEMLAQCPQPIRTARRQTLDQGRNSARGSWERRTVAGLRVRVRSLRVLPCSPPSGWEAI